MTANGLAASRATKDERDYRFMKLALDAGLSWAEIAAAMRMTQPGAASRWKRLQERYGEHRGRAD